jgi:uncharacterized protein YoxC
MDSKVAAGLVLVVLGLALTGPVASGDESSLSDSKFESPEGEAVMAIEKLVADNRKLREQIDDLRKVAANATSEAEVFKRQVSDLTHRMEALGASTASPTALEQRVLQAVNALRHAETSQSEVSSALARFAKVAGELAKKADPETKIVFDAELKKVDIVLAKSVAGTAIEEGAGADENSTLLMGKVSAVKPELDCVVINLGVRQGVKVGMPFRVKRGEREVALLRVVDVRQTFSGTVIQKLSSDKEPVKLGDAITVDAQL